MNTRGSLHFMISEFVILTILWVGFRHYFCNFGDKNFQRSLFFLPFLPFTKVYFHFTRIFWKYRHILNVYASDCKHTVFPLGGIHKLCTFTRFGFFDHLPPSVYVFYGINVYKKLIFLTTYTPPLANVVCERPLIEKICSSRW